MKRDKRYKFVRYGLLNHRQKQKRWVGTCEHDDVSFHTAPCPRGFYAMPYGLEEWFLLGSSTKFQEGILPFKKQLEFPPDDILYSLPDEEFDELFDKYQNIENYNHKILMDNRRIFYKPEGCVWHHLGDEVSRNEVEDESGAWVKTSMKAWYKALSKYKVRLGSDMDYGGGINWKLGSWNTTISRTRWGSKDSYEVFIDEKIH